MFELSVGRPYPGIVRKSNTVLHNFLTEHNTVVFVVSDMDEQKKHAMIHGEIEVGLLIKDNAIMFLWRFLVNNKNVVVMDGLFDALETHHPVLDDLHLDLERLPVIFHIVNGSTNNLEGVRVVTLPPAITINFFSAVQNQLSTRDRLQAKAVKSIWQQIKMSDRMKSTQMYRVGNARAKLKPRLSPNIRASLKRNTG